MRALFLPRGSDIINHNLLNFLFSSLSLLAQSSTVDLAVAQTLKGNEKQFELAGYSSYSSSSYRGSTVIHFNHFCLRLQFLVCAMSTRDLLNLSSCSNFRWGENKSLTPASHEFLNNSYRFVQESNTKEITVEAFFVTALVSDRSFNDEHSLWNSIWTVT